MRDIETLKRNLRKKPAVENLKPSDFLSSGSTLINLACSGRPFGCFAVGRYYLLVGDSASGKTFLSLTCLAEAASKRRFDKYRFIFDNAEDGALMNIADFFGPAVAERMEPPARDADGPVFSSTIEEFYYHVDDAIRTGKPFIYVLDSMDALTSADEKDKFQEQKKAHRSGKQAAGSYGDGKAKKNSAGLRKVLADLKRTGSLLIVINQTRDNLGFGFEKKTRSGGRALRFYATLELWSSVKQKLRKTVKGKQRQIGILTEVQVKKNRVTGRERTVTVPILHSYGIDDTSGCIAFLLEEGHWKGKDSSIVAPEFDFKGSKEKLVALIEEGGRQKELRLLVAQVWDELEQACASKRKRRYE